MPTRPPSRRALLRNFGLIAGGLVGDASDWEFWPQLTARPVPSKSAFRVGSFQKIYDPSTDAHANWYINDHTFICAADGQWHLFGITHREPAAPQDEKFLAHATSPKLTGPWTKREPVLPANSVRRGPKPTEPRQPFHQIARRVAPELNRGLWK